MASNPPGACCATGFRHTGETFGTISTIEEIESYTVGDINSKKILFLFIDVFGIKIPNPQLLADQFSEAGYLVFVPDLFEKDPYEGDIMSPNPPPGKNFFSDWLPKHTPEIVAPIATKFVDAVLKKYSPQYVATVGYCFGAKLSIELLGNGKANIAALAHPSFITIDEVKAIKGPIIILGAEDDVIYTEELRNKTEATLKEIKATYHTTLTGGVSHGFAIRGDLSIPMVKYAKEKAFTDTLQWFENFAPK